jgi:hypothetical protein
MGDDPVAAFRAIYAKRTQAISERRPDLVDEIYRSDCGCHELKSIVERAKAAGQHHRDYAPSVLRVLSLKEGFVPAENAANLRVITEQGPYTIATDDGTVIDRDPGWAPQSTYWELIRSPGGQWKTGQLTVEGTAEEVLGTGWREATP